MQRLTCLATAQDKPPCKFPPLLNLSPTNVKALGGSVVKNPPANAGDAGDMFDLWIGTIPWRRERLPTPIFLPGECHGKRNLADYSPWGHKELHMTEHTHTTKQPFFFSFSLPCVCRDHFASQ